MKRLILAALLLSAPAMAQDRPPPPEDPAPLIQEALTAYQGGEVAHARRALEEAIRSVAVKHANALFALLPQPFDGWTLEDSNPNEASLAVIGGGLSINRAYRNADGNDVTVEIIADSDLVAPVIQLYSDDSTRGAMGVTTETIGGETAYIEKDSGKIFIVTGPRTMISISGSAGADIVKSYAENINVAGIKALK